MNWIYNGYEITQLPQEIVGMVYQIYYTNGKSYIGSKMVRSKVKLKPLKHMRKNAVRYKVRENNWKSYEGSSKLTSGLTITTKVILYLTTNKRSMTYLEDRELFTCKALESDKYINENIRGKYWDNCLDGLYEHTEL
jgi:hypothetical protein